MKSLPWFRMYSDFIHDEMVEILAFEDQRHFVFLLCMKNAGSLDKDYPSDGMLDSVVSRRLGIFGEALVSAKRRMMEVGLIDANWQPTGWDKRQFVSDANPTNAERQKRYREAHKSTSKDSNVTRNVTVTLTDTDTDTDTDTEKKEQKTRAPRFDAQAHLVGMGVEPSIAADWIQSRKALKAAPTQTAIDGISREAAKARIALSDALAMCCQRGWRGFKAEWMSNGDQEHGARNAQQSRRPTIHDERAYTAAALTGRIPASTTIEEFMAGNVPGGAQGGMKLIEGEVIHAA